MFFGHFKMLSGANDKPRHFSATHEGKYHFPNRSNELECFFYWQASPGYFNVTIQYIEPIRKFRRKLSVGPRVPIKDTTFSS